MCVCDQSRNLCHFFFQFFIVVSFDVTSCSSVFDRLNGCRRENPQTCFIFLFPCLFPTIYRWNALNHCASGAHNSFSISWFWIPWIWRNFFFLFMSLFPVFEARNSCWFTSKKGKFLFEPNSIFIRRKIAQQLRRCCFCTVISFVAGLYDVSRAFLLLLFGECSLFIDLGDILLLAYHFQCIAKERGTDFPMLILLRQNRCTHFKPWIGLNSKCQFHWKMTEATQKNRS